MSEDTLVPVVPAVTPVKDVVSPFFGGDPIVNEDLGNVDSLLGVTPTIDPVVPAAAPVAPVVPPVIPPVTPVVEVPVVAPAAAVVEPVVPVKKPIMIPKERFDQTNERMKAAEKRVREFEQAQALGADGKVRIKVDANAKLAQHAKLILDGKEAEASLLMQDILNDVGSTAAQTAIAQVESTVHQVNERQAWNNLVTEVEQAVPILNPDSESFDADFAQRVMDFTNVYTRTMSRTAALEKAVFVALQTEKPELLAELAGTAPAQPAVVVAPPVTPVVPTPAIPSVIAAAQKAAATAKSIGAAQAQPAAAALNPGSSVAVLPKASEMSEEEYNALPAATRKRMRGDAL